MHVVDARNLNQAAPKVVRAMSLLAYRRDSRNGPVKTVDEPFLMRLASPWERVLYWDGRRDNPFLNFFDGLFALSKHNDADFMIQFSKNMAQYALDDLDKRYFPGHYGSRLRNHPLFDDQLGAACHKLGENPDDRRAVISLWGVPIDYSADSPDVPCNVMLLPKVLFDGHLGLTVINRSNDIGWGYLGVNPVQFSMIQEVMAAELRRPLGPLQMFTNNLHGYEEFGPWKWMVEQVEAGQVPEDFYETRNFRPQEMILPHENIVQFLWDVDNLVHMHRDFGVVSEPRNFQTQFFKHTVVPMLVAWEAMRLAPKKPEPGLAHEIQRLCDHVLSPDWREAIKAYFAPRTV